MRWCASQRPLFGASPFEPFKPIAQAEVAAPAQAIGKKERERLRQMEVARREQLDKVREDQNRQAAEGDVSGGGGGVPVGAWCFLGRKGLGLGAGAEAWM